MPGGQCKERTVDHLLEIGRTKSCRVRGRGREGEGGEGRGGALKDFISRPNEVSLCIKNRSHFTHLDSFPLEFV